MRQHIYDAYVRDMHDGGFELACDHELHARDLVVVHSRVYRVIYVQRVMTAALNPRVLLLPVGENGETKNEG